MVPLVRRWQLEPLRKFFFARCAKLAAVQGVWARSILISMSPLLVLSTMVTCPVTGTLPVGGVPMSLAEFIWVGVHAQVPFGAAALGEGAAADGAGCCGASVATGAAGAAAWVDRGELPSEVSP